jgi:hypothetical protein
VADLSFELTVTTLRKVEPQHYGDVHQGQEHEPVRVLHVAITEAEFLELRNAILARWGNHV